MRQVILYPGEIGYWIAECPSLPGCVSQGKTKEEAIQNIREAIESSGRQCASRFSNLDFSSNGSTAATPSCDAMFHPRKWSCRIIRNSTRAPCGQSCAKPEYHRASSVLCSRSSAHRIGADRNRRVLSLSQMLGQTRPVYVCSRGTSQDFLDNRIF